MDTYRFQPGETPVLLTIPHVGTTVPPDIGETMTEEALRLPDTDWHLDRLYHFAPALGVGFLKPVYSRYVIDLNRDPSGEMEPGGPVRTGLCPVATFDGAPIHRPGMAPDASEIARRIALSWQPYHDRLERELAALRDRFGVAVLIDAHSMRAGVIGAGTRPLADVNLGTADGASAAPSLVARMMNVVRATQNRTQDLDNHFKGGYTVRAYGRPAEGIHALQVELDQATYMDDRAPFRFRPERAAEIRPVLERLLQSVVEWAWENATVGRRRRSPF